MRKNFYVTLGGLTRHYDKNRYKAQNLIERFFNRLKPFRRLATHYDKLA
jgi:transposase